MHAFKIDESQNCLTFLSAFAELTDGRGAKPSSSIRWVNPRPFFGTGTQIHAASCMPTDLICLRSSIISSAIWNFFVMVASLKGGRVAVVAPDFRDFLLSFFMFILNTGLWTSSSEEACCGGRVTQSAFRFSSYRRSAVSSSVLAATQSKLSNTSLIKTWKMDGSLHYLTKDMTKANQYKQTKANRSKQRKNFPKIYELSNTSIRKNKVFRRENCSWGWFVTVRHAASG